MPEYNQLMTIVAEEVKFVRLNNGETNCLNFAIKRGYIALRDSLMRDLAYKLG